MIDTSREQGDINCYHMFQMAINIGGETCCSHCKRPMNLSVMAMKHIEVCKAMIASKEKSDV
jgi:hypothetical protein